MSKFFDLHTVAQSQGSPASAAVIFASSTDIAANPLRSKLVFKNLGAGVILISTGVPLTTSNLYELAVGEELQITGRDASFAYQVRTAVAATTATLISLEVL